MKNKKAFALFLTLILVYLFSILSIQIYQLKAINSTNIIKQHTYLQGKNHMNFLKEYISNLEDLQSINKIEIKNKNFKILASIKKIESNKFEAFLIVEALEEKVRLFECLELTK